MTTIDLERCSGAPIQPPLPAGRPARRRTGRSGRPDTTRRRLLAAGVVLLVALGALERWWVASHALGTLTSDGSVIGLMALHLLHHAQLPAYMWGQSYGGSLEVVLTAAIFLVAGAGTGALLATTALSSALVALALWRTGRLIVGERAAALGALAWWVWPATATWRSLKPGGSYMIGLAIALAAVGALAKVRQGNGGAARLALTGAWCGLAVWTSPMALQLLLPALLWCAPAPALARLRPRRLLGALVAGAFAGAAPALVFGATHHWSNLHMPGGDADAVGGFVGRLAQFVGEEWPIALSLRVEGSLAWVGGAVGGAGAAGALLAVLVLGAMVALGRARRCALPVLTLVLLPVVFALNPLADHVGQGRYVIFGATMVALLVGVGLDELAQRAVRRRRDRGWRPVLAWASGLALLAALGLVALSMEPAGALAGFQAPDVAMPSNDAGLQELVAAHHVHYAYANYWIAYRLTFETDEATEVTPYDLDRYPPLAASVARSDDPAYLFVSASATVDRFEHWCAAHGIAVRTWRAGGFTVVEPAVRVRPAQVGRSVLG